MPWVGLQRVIVVIPDHTHIFFHIIKMKIKFGLVFNKVMCFGHKILLKAILTYKNIITF